MPIMWTYLRGELDICYFFGYPASISLGTRSWTGWAARLAIHKLAHSPLSWFSQSLNQARTWHLVLWQNQSVSFYDQGGRAIVTPRAVPLSVAQTCLSEQRHNDPSCQNDPAMIQGLMDNKLHGLLSLKSRLKTIWTIKPKPKPGSHHTKGKKQRTKPRESA